MCAASFPDLELKSSQKCMIMIILIEPPVDGFLTAFVRHGQEEDIVGEAVEQQVSFECTAGGKYSLTGRRMI